VKVKKLKMFDCYNKITHTCDGRCQGASDCPLAHDVNVSRDEMKLYIENVINQKEELDKIINELHKDEEFIKSIEEIRKKLKF